MEKSPTTSSKSIERFWDRYLELLHNQGIKPSADRWYVIHAERYIKSFPDKKLADHGPQEVTGYLQQLGRTRRFRDRPRFSPSNVSLLRLCTRLFP